MNNTPHSRLLDAKKGSPHYELAKTYLEGIAKSQDWSTKESSLQSIEQIVIRMKEYRAQTYKAESLEASEKARKIWNALELVVYALNKWYQKSKYRKGQKVKVPQPQLVA